MFRYYLSLALRSLERNAVLTALMIATIGVGIGASMTMLAILRAASGDPIPRKSSQLFVPQIDNWGLGNTQARPVSSDGLPTNLTYQDAMGFMRAHAAPRQAAMYETQLVVTPPDAQRYPFQAGARATFADFFPMFDVPFEYGGPWNSAEDEAHAAVVVISRALDDRLFGGGDSVGRTLVLGERPYRVVGVLRRWAPMPRFYDLNTAGGTFGFGGAEQLLLPFNDAVDQQLGPTESLGCSTRGKGAGAGWSGLLHSECIWIQYWAELPGAAAVRRYHSFLRGYVLAQQRDGRFDWLPRIALRDVHQWLAYNHVVPDSVNILVEVSFGFLLVCLLNAMGLMLAKFLARSASLSVRRVLGANRRAVFAQCLAEASIVGLAGGLIGLALTTLGLAAGGLLLGRDLSSPGRLDGADVLIAVALAIAAALIAGLYPAWRATRVQPAWQLKAQ